MASQTFRDVWGLVSLHCPLAPPSLTQHWVQLAYDRLIGKRHWSWTKREFILTTLAARSVTVNVLQGSTALTGVGVFASTDQGRQFRVGTGPTYTINTVTVPNAATLTQNYAETSGAVTAVISDVYAIMPADFRSFEDVVDRTIQRPIPWWISGERLNLWDPARISSDARFRILASAFPSQVTAYAGRLTYEMWPRPTAAGSYIVRYFLRTDALDDDTILGGLLATHAASLRTGALAEAAMWPGTTTQKNPYFNLPLARQLKAEFEQDCKQIDVMDDDQYLMDLLQVDLARFGLAALSADTTLLRASDATLHDYS